MPGPLLSWESPEAQRIARSIAWRLTRSSTLRAWREDLAQEALLGLGIHGPAEEPVARTIMRRRAIDAMRLIYGRHRAPDVLSPFDEDDRSTAPTAPDNPCAEAVDRVETERLVKVIGETLPLYQVEALMSSLEHGGQRALAKRWGLTESAISQHVRRSRKAVADALRAA